MTYYRRAGQVPTKRHTHVVDDTGHRYAEELMGQAGFSSASSLLYHRHSPSALTAIDSVAPLVETISRGSAFTSSATLRRASSTASSACQPKLCEREAGLPNRPSGVR